jgi:predicted AlkP superfamily phosphohydrolase/phosphomutase
VLLLQLDAADADLLESGIADGTFPTLRSLCGTGASGRVDSPPGFGSGAAWATFATGVSPATHGRYFYRQVGPGDYVARPFEGDDFRVPAIWESLSDAGRRVAVIDAPGMACVEGINGISVADWITHDLVYQALRTSPPGLADDLIARFGENPVVKCDQPGGRDRMEHRRLLDQLLARIDQKERAVRHYLALEDWDFFSVAFAEPHCVGHQCWHLRDPLHPLYDPADARAVPDPVVSVYAAIDRAIGRILADVGPETTVIVFSATGMGPNYTGNLVLDEVLRRIEGVAATAPAAATARLKRMLKGLLPLGVRRRYRPLKRRVEERAQEGDRARRRAFMVPHNDISGAIRLNVVGREASGVLRPGPEVDAYVKQLTEALLALRNLDTGGPVVDRVVRVADHCEGPALDELPDLFAMWSRETYPDRIGSDRVGEIVFRHRGNRTGDHLPVNVFFAVGPGIEAGRLDGRSILDFAPTIAALLDAPTPACEGEVIEALVPERAARRLHRRA